MFSLLFLISAQLLLFCNGMVIYNNTNNMYSCINESGASTEQLISLGKMSSLQDCENAFNSNNKYRSFIYYPSSFDQHEWKHYCYVRTDTWWTPQPQLDVISGQIDNFNNCFSNFDCELNGKCVNNHCECKPAFTGTFCQYMNFKKGSKDLGYQRKDYSQWGGMNYYNGVTDEWIMFATEMYGNCGIDACCCGNSQIVQTISKGINNAGGPYTFNEVILPYFAHEPNLGKTPDGYYLLHHWGDADSNQVKPVTGCIDGYTFGLPPDSDILKLKSDKDNPVTYNYISYSKSINGPWQQMKIPGDDMDSDLCPSNPYIFDNGSVLMFWTERASWNTGSVIHLMTADSWNSTYTLDDNQLWVTQLYDGSSMEDPFLYRDSSDNTFHLIMHGMIYVDNPDGNPWLRAGQGRHAYSMDGLIWILSPHYTYNTTICYDTNECIDYARRERPHIVFDPNTNEPIYLTNGMQLNNNASLDKTFLSAVPLYTSNDYCNQGKTEYCH